MQMVQLQHLHLNTSQLRLQCQRLLQRQLLLLRQAQQLVQIW